MKSGRNVPRTGGEAVAGDDQAFTVGGDGRAVRLVIRAAGRRPGSVEARLPCLRAVAHAAHDDGAADIVGAVAPGQLARERTALRGLRRR